MQVKCPKCAAVLKLAAAPASGKVKCPKCAAIVSVGAGKPAAPRQTARPSAPSPTPAVPPTGSGEVDFSSLPGTGQIPVRTYQQLGELSVHIPEPEDKPVDEGDDEGTPSSSGKPTKGGSRGGKPDSKKIMVAVGVLVTLLMLFSVGGYFAFTSLASGGGVASEVARKPPSGFSLYRVEGVSIFLPHGQEMELLPSELKFKAVQTDSLTIFLMGSTGASYKPMDGKKLKQKLSRLLNAGFLGGTQKERNGYPCTSGMLDQAVGIGRMKVEIFQDEGRIIVLGISMPGGNVVVGQSAEPEKQKVFYDSFKIGPKPAGGFFGN